MKLDKLKQYRDQFKQDIQGQKNYAHKYKWECQEIFQKHWNNAELDLATMYNKSLTHPESGSLWGGNHQSAKSMMLLFIDNNPEFVRAMFRDLFNEEKDLNMRIERFRFHCDQLLQKLMSHSRKINHHFHDDFYMPTLYLALKYPNKYCIYDAPAFVATLQAIEAKDPLITTFHRFQKVIPIIQSQLMQDDEMLPLLKTKLSLRDETLYHSRWLAYEFYQFVASRRR